VNQKGSSSGPKRLLKIILPLALITFTTLVGAPAFAKEKLPEVSSDGLHLVPHTKLRIVYMKPGVNLDAYDEVKILDCFVQFRKDYQRDYNLNEIGLQGRVTSKDMEDIKTWLAAEFKKVFTEQLDKKGQEVVDTVGPSVLLLRPAIINLDVTAPDTMQAGMVNNYVASAGEMTLYMELYDSATSELIGRVVDPEAGQEGGLAFNANRVTNTAAADRILRFWADLLSSHLGSVKNQAGQ